MRSLSLDCLMRADSWIDLWQIEGPDGLHSFRLLVICWIVGCSNVCIMLGSIFFYNCISILLVLGSWKWKACPHPQSPMILGFHASWFINYFLQVVVTIWYRAPELLLGAKHYTSAVGILITIFCILLFARPYRMRKQCFQWMFIFPLNFSLRSLCLFMLCVCLKSEFY